MIIGYAYVFNSGTSKSTSRYADFYKNGYFLVDGKSIQVDTRVYVWTNNTSYRAAFYMSSEKSYTNCWVNAVQYCSTTKSYCHKSGHRKELNVPGIVYMEFHFYEAGHIGNSSYELSNVSGCSKFEDIDGTTSTGYGNEAWGLEQGSAVTYYKTSSTSLKSATKLPRKQYYTF